MEPTAEHLFDAGQAFARHRQWEQAANSFRGAVAIDPHHVRAQFFLGRVLLEMGELDAAVIALARAFELDQDEARPTLAQALVAQANARLSLGDQEGALAACERALQVSPGEPLAQKVKAMAWTYRGDVALEQGDVETALAAFQKAGNSERIERLETVQTARQVKELEAEALSFERDEWWEDAALVYEELLSIVSDEAGRSKWLAALERCEAEKRIARLFTAGLEAFGRQEWERAQAIFADVVRQRPDYARGGKLAAGLLAEAINATATVRPEIEVPFQDQEPAQVPGDVPAEPAAAPLEMGPAAVDAVQPPPRAIESADDLVLVMGEWIDNIIATAERRLGLTALATFLLGLVLFLGAGAVLTAVFNSIPGLEVLGAQSALYSLYVICMVASLIPWLLCVLRFFRCRRQGDAWRVFAPELISLWGKVTWRVLAGMVVIYLLMLGLQTTIANVIFEAVLYFWRTFFPTSYRRAFPLE